RRLSSATRSTSPAPTAPAGAKKPASATFRSCRSPALLAPASPTSSTARADLQAPSTDKEEEPGECLGGVDQQSRGNSEHSAKWAAAKERVWARYVDVANWREWSGGGRRMVA